MTRCVTWSVDTALSCAAAGLAMITANAARILRICEVPYGGEGRACALPCPSVSLPLDLRRRVAEAALRDVLDVAVATNAQRTSLALRRVTADAGLQDGLAAADLLVLRADRVVAGPSCVWLMVL